MAVEKVVMATVIGRIEDVDSFTKDIFLFNDVQLLDAMTEIDAGRFVLPVTVKNIDELLAFSNPKAHNDRELQRKCQDYINRLETYYENSLSFKPEVLVDKKIEVDQLLKEVDTFLVDLDQKAQELNFNLKQLNETNESLQAYSFLKEIDISLRDLRNLNNFYITVGSVTNDNASRLKLIYPNMPAVFFHVGDNENNEQVFLVIVANDFKSETDRVLRALDFKKVEGFNNAYEGTPREIIKMLEDKKQAIESNIEVLTAVQKGNLRKLREQADLFYNELVMLIKTNTIKSYMSFSERDFYFAGWVPKRELDAFNERISNNKDLITVFSDPGQDSKPPTKLVNNWLFRPFEQLVYMYGVPNYHELDPTPFLSLTYILFFGYMFGDVGQGLVLLLGGLYVEKKGIKLGGVVARIAVASIIFGFLYGSVFGIETIIPTLWLKPMEDTTTLLLTAVVLGVIALVIAYIYGLINKRREGEIGEEYFGKNGLSGFAIYVLVLLLALMLYHYLPTSIVLDDIVIALIVICTILVFLALPLTNLLYKRPLMQGIEGEYYVSSFFEVFEMYLSMLSNTLSFIRVGAFALTHVGMFMAFSTIAQMVGGGVAGVVVLVVGNIFIICLEGLIDFIQCLRLEFYELFGKYYDGDGVSFVTIEEAVNETI